jgi:Dockerin type I domain
MLPRQSATRIGQLLDEPDDESCHRGSALRGRAAAILAAIFLAAIHAGHVSGSIDTPRTRLDGDVATTKRHDGHEDPRMEFTQKLGAAAGAAAMSLTAMSLAQNAVQWRVEDGGNGHWYARNNASLTWEQAIASAQARGGQLATTTSSAELAFIGVHLISDGMFCWLGGTIDCSGATGPCCDNCAWRWTSGEPFDVSWTGWIGDNDYTTERLVTNGVGFDDMCSPCIVIDYRPPSIIEWSADCNNDGLVDYGQIRDGQLADSDGNGVPDCCANGTCIVSPVQWATASGGNGHWYAGVPTSGPITWTDARAAAEARGGHLATISSAAEDGFVAPLALLNPSVWPIADRYGPWLGGFQPKPSSDPFGNWAWVTGEPWSYIPATAQFDNSTRPDGQYDDYLHYIDHTQVWNDVRDDGDIYYGIGVRAYMIEWSADCNNDGLVDFGQIRAGELDDANGNNIPDCCESGPACNCRADIARDGIVNGIDLAAVLNNWGTPGGPFNADINGDGDVNGADLSEVLSAWGPCP